MKKYNTHGFTLIELSIVLVIIGLLVSGVLVGRDLIKGAEVRQQISQIEQYNTAVYTFRQKYNCLPGDCANATNFSAGFTNGDGNGVVCPPVNAIYPDSFGAYYYGANPSECVEFWHQLSVMRLIPDTILSYATGPHNGVGEDYPLLKNGGSNNSGMKAGIWILHPGTFPMQLSGKHGYFLTASVQNDEDRAATFSPMDAYHIDSKIDDGLSFLYQGKVMAVGDTVADPWQITAPYEGVAGATGCLLNDGSGRYNVTNTNRKEYFGLCGLIVQAGF